jgi:hypothetical protein
MANNGATAEMAFRATVPHKFFNKATALNKIPHNL